jgi:hypothetical protein
MRTMNDQPGVDRPDGDQLAAIDDTLSQALATCHQALADHQAGLLSDDELRKTLFQAGLVRRPDEALLLDLESGRWQRYDGITISECPAPVRKTDVARWKQVVRSLQPSEGRE